mmetsp:Transcript_71461/g.225687  ORF Transcript_71461/g.225687 Transcript_71461/m.225687 type:complete len:431 (-) Transcript_71461:34-1326(-)|eukprot:CAMPEP_0182870490 /NCGR_PEP_ID=MMETSP0034_2-20130328/10556_1 /TAXON_ID=156128 /ORGANISM="Nephroselmis pyriformis, Strain CCMP717" /LENGTH=430 /DNA_ID=CAMNT_0025002989 /DNA_START=177 /DNA_END=1469 /DNA_ORIENTATION=-
MPPRRGLKVRGPFAGIQAKIDEGLTAAKGVATKAPFVFVAFTFVLGIVKASRNAKLQDRIDALKDRRRRINKLNDVRANVVGPLKKAVEDLIYRMDLLMVQEKDNFFGINYRDNAALAVDSTLYLFCKYFFWRYQLEWNLQFEKLEENDQWFVTVEQAFKEISLSFSDADEKYAAYDTTGLIYSMMDKARASLTGAPASPNSLTSHDTTPPEGSSGIVAAGPGGGMAKWPFRMLDSQRQAVGELMMSPAKGEGGRTTCVSFTAFVTNIEKAVINSKETDRDNDHVSASSHAWAVWVLPLRRMVVRFADLTTQDITRLDLAQVRELTRTRMRLRLIQGELRDLAMILDKDPNDKWFRKKRVIVNKPKSKAAAARAAKAVARWQDIRKRIPHILMRAAAGGDAWPDEVPTIVRCRRLLWVVPVPFTRVVVPA